MSNISRRTALTTGAALVTTGAIAAPLAIKAAGVKAALAGDTDLLAMCAEWHRLWDISAPLWREVHHLRTKADAHPDCPPLGGSYEALKAHWRRFGLTDQHDRAQAAFTPAFDIAVRLFETPAYPAYTLEGVQAKVGVAMRLHLEPEVIACPPLGDILANIHADLERLAGEAPS